MEIKILEFNQLDIHMLYELLQLRSAVFVVEQDCVYQDIDDKDQKAIHVLGYKEGNLVAYTRIFNKGFYFDEASIGRVLTKRDQRKYGYGKLIMQASINELESRFAINIIHISAQTYLKKFYNELGFVEFGEAYLEDNIPHIKMVRTK
ncbi:GNAT family N-acetyltransferase [Leeuwenhoekiella sp. NPDC079379]|uniref:GNAT family N-acetyltransferase n=1 Tax=Leeuwenhoekiella sp. NPDC079379 TaxID=3364122 RepID=UPI0037C9A4EE